MKTIKERAEAIANDVLRKVNKKAEEDGGFVAPQYDESVRNLIVASYIRGAEDQRGIDIEEFHPIMEENVLKAIEKQKQIDIEKACKWLIEHFRATLSSGDCVFEEILFTTEIEEEFRKAMEKV